MVKNPHASAGHATDAGSVLGLGRTLEVGNGSSLQYSWEISQFYNIGISEIHQTLAIVKDTLWINRHFTAKKKKFPNSTPSGQSRMSISQSSPLPPPSTQSVLDFPADMKKP